MVYIYIHIHMYIYVCTMYNIYILIYIQYIISIKKQAVLSLFLLLPGNGTQTLKKGLEGGATGGVEQWLSNFAALLHVRTTEEFIKLTPRPC